jgi:tetratricopeptide (TPR) repeat protein
LAAALINFWQVRGHMQEGRTWLETAAAVPGPLTRDRAYVMGGLAAFAFDLGDLEAAEVANRACFAAYEQLGDSAGLLRALNRGAVFAEARGDSEEATLMLERAIDGARAVGDNETVAGISINLGHIAFMRGDYSSAAAHFRESLQLFRDVGDPNGVSTSLGNLAQTLLNLGDVGASRDLLEESLRISEGLGNRQARAYSLQALGEVEFATGALGPAHDRYVESLALARDLGLASLVAECLEGLARVAVERDPEAAMRLAGAAEAIRKSVGAAATVDSQRHAKHLQPAHDALGPKRAAAARNEGRRMSRVDVDNLAGRLRNDRRNDD